MIRTLKNSMINRLLVLGVLALGLTTIAKAESINIDGLYYELNEDEGTASVTYQTTTSSNYSSLSAELIIPSSVSYNDRNYIVTSITDKAFYYCKKIESIKIPSSVIQIGSTTTTSSNRPFYNCTALKSLWFEDGDEPIYFGSVYSTSTGTSMFSGCPIEEIYLGRPINVSNYNDSYPYSSNVSRYGYSPFYNLTQLKKVVIGKNISSLNKYLFYKCTGLTTLDFSSSNVKSIEAHCFNGCTGLTQFENPPSLSKIGESAFYGCRGLVNLKLTNLILSGSSFYQCTGLKNLEIDCETIPEKCFYGCTNLSNIQFGRNVKFIENLNFNNCTSLTEIEIPANIERIGSTMTTTANRPFYGCSALKNLTIQDDDKNIILGSYYSSSTGASVFSGCPIESVYIGRKILYDDYNEEFPSESYPKQYGYSAFYNQSKLKNATIGSNINSLDQYFFYNCEYLNQINFIGENCKEIEKYCFNGCSSLSAFTSPTNLEKIGDYAFYGCSALSQFIFSDKLLAIGNYSFYGCSNLTEFISTSSLKSIGESAFYGCKRIQSLQLGNIELGNSCFYQCTGLKNLEIDCETIPEKCFYGCTNLSNIQFGRNVKFIENLNFNNCTSLTEIEIPANIERIGSTMTTTANRPFYGCSNLKKVKIEDSPTILNLAAYYSSNTGASIFSGCPLEEVYLGREFIYTDYNTTYPFENNGKRYGYSIFYNQTKLQKVTLGDNITKISPYLFYECSNIKDFTIPTSITSIGNYAFYNCTGLKNFNIPGFLETIGSYAFYGCTGITDLQIPNSVKEIGESAFYGCKGIQSLNLGNIKLGSSCFYQCTGLTTLNINSEVIPENCFFGCSNLSDIKFGDSVKIIENLNFNNCASLNEIVIPANVERIGKPVTTSANRPFYGSTGLQKIKFEDGTGILRLGSYYSGNGTGYGLFYGCPLEEVYLGRNLQNIDFNTASTFDSYPQRYGYSPFYNQSKLKNVIVSSSVTTLNKYLFYKATQLEIIDLTNAPLCDIKEYCFYGCTGLVNIILPESIASIGEYAFYQCSGLKEIELYNAQLGQYAFYQCTNLSSVSLNCEIVPARCFYNCTALSKIQLGHKVKTIENYNFNNCLIEEVVFPASLIKLGSKVASRNISSNGSLPFGNCVNLEKVVFEDSNEPIQLGYLYDSQSEWNDSYFRYSNLKELVLGRDVIGEDGGSPFDYTLTLKKVTLRGGFSTFIPRMFYNNSALNEVIIDAKCEGEIGEYCFYYCNSLESIPFKDPMFSKIKKYAFYKCSSLIEIDLGESINEIEESAFYDCTSARRIYFGDTVELIGEKAFYNCTSLEEIFLGTKLKEIKNGTFFNCASLTQITIPSNVTIIGKVGELSQSSIYDPAHEIPPVKVFGKCTSLKRITFEDGEEALTYAPQNVLADCPIEEAYLGRDSKYQYWHATTNGYVDFHNIAYSQTYSPLSNLTTLRNVSIGPKVSILNDHAFYGCTGLEEVLFNDTQFDKILSHCFYNCSSLKSIELPDNISSVESYAFYNCKKLEKVKLGHYIESIGYNAFYNCSSLKEVNSYNLLPPSCNNSNCFSTYTKQEGTLYVYETALEDYKEAPVWKEFFNIQTIPNQKTVSIFGNKKVIKETETLQLTASVYPIQSSLDVVEWTSSNNEIASVSSDGTVTAVREGEVSITASLSSEQMIRSTYNIIVEPRILGDSNDSKSVNVADLITSANYIVHKEIPSFCFVNADVNEDKEISIVDISATANIMLGEMPSMSKQVKQRYNSTSFDKLQVDNFIVTSDEDFSISVKLENLENYTGLQASFIVPEGMIVKDVIAGNQSFKHNLIFNISEDGLVDVVLFSASNEAFYEDETPLFKLIVTASENCGNILLTNILATDPNAYGYDLSFEGGLNITETTGLHKIETRDKVIVVPVNGQIHVRNAENCEIRVFSLSGLLISSLIANSDIEKINVESGIYIVTINNKSFKVQVK